MKKMIYVLSIVAASALISACGKSSNSNNNNNGYVNGVCYGTVANGICYPTNTTVNSKTGYFGVSSLITGSNTNNALRNFLRYRMGVCDLSSWSWGNASCDQWLSSKFDIVVNTTSGSSSAQVKFRVYPQTSAWGASAGVYAPTGAYCGVMYSGYTSYPYCEIAFESVVSQINSSQGLELRSNGINFNNLPNSAWLLQVQLTDFLQNKAEGSSYSARVFFPDGTNPQQIFSTNNIVRRSSF